MKTFTLRLTENEAEALTRLAGMNGFSKNDFLRQLIATAYGKIDTKAVIKDSVITTLNHEEYVSSLCEITDFPKTVYERFCSSKSEEELTGEERLAISNACKSSMERLRKKSKEDSVTAAIEEIEKLCQKMYNVYNEKKYILFSGKNNYFELVGMLKN